MLAKLRQSGRLLLRNPVWTLVGVIALGLGIGATTAGISILRAVVINALPYAKSDELVILAEAEPKASGQPMLPVRASTYFQWREQASSFKDMLICNVGAAALTGAGEPERVSVANVSWNTLDVLGVDPIMGRGFAPQEDEPGKSDVALISYGLWNRQFAGSRAVIGQTVQLDSKPYSIIGVTPDGFRFPGGYELAGFVGISASFKPDVWVPIGLKVVQPSARKNYNYGVVARVKSGVSLEEAAAEMQIIMGRLRSQYPDAFKDNDVTVTSLRDFVVRTTKLPAYLLMLGSLILLLMSFLNVSTMLTARMIARRREMAIRMALGAGLRQLFRQMLIESVLFSLVGGLVGIIVAIVGVRGLALLAGEVIPRLDTANVDWPVLILGGLIVFIVSIAFTLISIWVVGKGNLAQQLKEGGATINELHQPGRAYLRNGLIALQTALSLVLLLGFSLLAVSYAKLMRVETGFQPNHILKFQVQLNLSRYKEPESWQLFLTNMLTELGSLPGVKSAAAIENLPLTGDANISETVVEGDPSDSGRQVEYRRISPRYFETLGINTIEGRIFNDADTPESLPVAIISKTMADQYWPGQDPLGRRFHREKSPWRVVIGVVGDVRHSGLDQQPRPQAYIPYSQQQAPWMMFAIRTEGDPSQLIGHVRATARGLDNEQPIAHLETMEQQVLESVSKQRFLLRLLMFFGITALVLTVTGVFGIVSYIVNRRLREMGIRMAIGARPWSLFWLVMRQHMLPVAIGILAGILSARLLVDYLASLLYRTSPTDPLVYALTVVCFCAVAFVALFLPARRAATVDPVRLLRTE